MNPQNQYDFSGLTDGPSKNVYDFKGVEQKPPPSSYNRNLQSRQKLGTRAGNPGTSNGRISTAISANKTAGYNDRKFDPIKNPSGYTSGDQPKLAKNQKSEQENYRQKEKVVNKLVEESAEQKSKGNIDLALEKAKEAANKERQLRRTRESAGMIEQINIDLTYCVCFNLAVMYQAKGMRSEALNTYSLLVKNKNYPQAGRLRVNIGNIFFNEGGFKTASKMYKMALDIIPATNREMRVKISKNIGLSLIRMAQSNPKDKNLAPNFQDAIETFESVMKLVGDWQTGYNLVMCFFMMRDKDKMKEWFGELINIETPGRQQGDDASDSDDGGLDNEDEQDEDQKAKKQNDELREYLRKKRSKSHKYISSAAKLIAPVIDDGPVQGYDWIIQALRSANQPAIENQIEICKAVYFVKRKQFEKAIDVFKSFEKKDRIMKAKASNNISFLYFLENDFKSAEKYADNAIKQDRYNAKALVNKGNCLFIKQELQRSKQLYLQAIGVEADCVEAIYNLGLVYKKLGSLHEALQAFEKLQSIVPSSPEVIFQLATVNEAMGMYKQALKWYNILITKVPRDAGVLYRMGNLCQKEEDQTQALQYYLESYRYFPVKIDVISWLGIRYVKQDLYQKAVQFFQKAILLQPDEVKWKLMVGSCYRRMNSYQQAYKMYEEIIQEHPDNVQCLRYLVTISKELGYKYDHYSMQLKKLQRMDDMRNQQQMRFQPQQQEQDYEYNPKMSYMQQQQNMQQPPQGFDDYEQQHFSGAGNYGSNPRQGYGMNEAMEKEQYGGSYGNFGGDMGYTDKVSGQSPPRGAPMQQGQQAQQQMNTTQQEEDDWGADDSNDLLPMN